MSDYTRLVEQAREMRPAATGEAAFRFIQEAPPLLAGLADAVEQLQRDGAEDREAAARYDDLGQVLNERDVPRYEDTGDPDDAYEADVDTRVGWVLDDLDRARARVAELEARLADIGPADEMSRPKVYIEPRDWWIGYYRGDRHHYVCLLPCVVIRRPRRGLGCCFRCEERVLAKLSLEERMQAPVTFAPCACGNKRCQRPPQRLHRIERGRTARVRLGAREAVVALGRPTNLRREPLTARLRTALNEIFPGG